MVKESPWMDRLSFIFSLVVVLIAVLWIWEKGVFNIDLTAEQNVVWYLIRAAGISAYVLLTVSMVWGLAVTSRIVKDWSPGVVSMLMHSTISWLAVIFTIVHAGLLMLDHYMPYTLSELLIPFSGPYRPLAVGLGVLAFWIALAVALSFSVKERIGRRTWKLLHLTSYGAYGLVTVHMLLAGTDSTRLGFQILIGISVILLVLLTGHRLTKVAH